MEQINQMVADNLKRIREERKLSLDAIAKLTGVSKSMLGQIERGDVNPTISTLWKIVLGLKLSFSDLISRPEVDVEVVEKDTLQPLQECGGAYRNYPVFPFEDERGFETYYIEIDPGCHLQADPHTQNSQEFITVFSSTLTVEVDGQELKVSEGSSVRFKSDRPHSYCNSGDTICKLSMIISYKK